MPNEWEDDDQDEQKQTPKGLRAQLEAVLAKNKELEATNTKLASQVRTNAISQALSAKGFDPKVAKLVPSDVEPTNEAVEKWLEEFSDVLPKAKVEEPVTPADTPDGSEEVEDQEQAAGTRIAQVANGAQAPSKQQDLMKQVQGAKSPEEIIKLIEAAGGGFGSG